jgi:hypothetical protein
MIKIKAFLCLINFHWWKLTNDTRQCVWCSKHQEIEDIEAGVMGGLDIVWRDL